MRVQTLTQFEPQCRAASQSRQPQRRRDAGASLVELLIVVAILLVVLAIALPRLMAARQSAQEAAAVMFLRNLHAAQEQYRFANGNYAGAFAELDSFLAAHSRDAGGHRPLPARMPALQSETMPALAFLLLPAMSLPDEPAYASDGPARPKGTDEHKSGAGTPRGEAPRGSNANPPGKNSDGNDPGAGERGERGDDGGAGHPPGGASPGDSAGESQGADWSKADRITYQGYEFHLLRLTAHTWRCLATPVRDRQNTHHYFADQGGAIRREFGRPAGAQSPVL
jgi:type II secretory pathway pseudopilin PulG